MTSHVSNGATMLAAVQKCVSVEWPFAIPDLIEHFDWSSFHEMNKLSFSLTTTAKQKSNTETKQKMAPKWDIVIHPITKRTETRFNRRLSWCKHFFKVQGGLFYNVFLQLLAMQFKIRVLTFFFCAPLNPRSVHDSQPDTLWCREQDWWQGIRQVWQCLYLYTYRGAAKYLHY